MPIKIVSEAYSAVRQASYAQSGVSSEALLGEMRSDLLFSRQIVIPDTHLFDGAFLLRTAPVELIKELGGNRGCSPLQVKFRAETFDQSLVAFYSQSASGVNVPLRLHLISDPALRERVRSQLTLQDPTTTRKRLQSKADVCASTANYVRSLILQSGGDPRETVSLIERLRQWQEAIDTGLVEFSRWSGTYDLEAAVRADPLVIGRDIREPRVIELVNWIFGQTANGTATRTIVVGAIETLVDEASAAEAVELDAIRHWFDYCRIRAMARQHGCSPVRSLFVDAVLERRMALLGNDPSAARAVSRDLLQPIGSLAVQLGGLTADEFRRLIIEAEVPLHLWWYHGEASALQDVVAKCLSKSVTPTSEAYRILAGALAAAGGAALEGPLGAAVAAGAASLGVEVRDRARTKRAVAQVLEVFRYR